MKNIIIITNKEKPKATEFEKKISAWLKKQKIAEDGQFAIVLGGDGTMIKAAREFAAKDIPLFGVNLGKLGFLAETDVKNVFASLKKIISGSYKIEERAIFKIEIFRKKKLLRSFLGLNDAVIKNGINSRVIQLHLIINDKPVTEIVGDGIIVSTPTGSTAYSLACSGPIVHPQTKSIIITPIAPHTLTQRPVIVPDDFVVSVGVDSGHKNVVLSVDGQMDMPLILGDTVRIKKSDITAKLITLGRTDYFEVLRRKLNWGKR